MDGIDVDGMEAKHIRVVEMLCHNFALDDLVTGTPYITNPWKDDFVTGQLPNGDFAHVFIS